jgi:hypothetical protein
MLCMERAAGIEPATDGLEDRGSASELYPRELAESASGPKSPTIATAMAAEYERLDVYCDGGRHKVQILWALIRRPPEAALVDLTGDLTCRRCGPKGPLPQILRVSR